MTVREINDDRSGEEEALLRIKPQKSGCFGRLCEWIKPRKVGLVRGLLATVSVVSTFVLSYFTVTQFQENAQYPQRNVYYGASLGVSATILTGSLLPPNIGAGLADWFSRWAYEWLEGLTQLYLNAGCPINGAGFWNDNLSTPPPIKTAAAIGFAFVAATVALLSLRSLTPKKPQAEDTEETSDDDYALVRDAPQAIRMLESGKDDLKWFVAEQITKGILGGLLIFFQAQQTFLTADEWAYFGFYLAGNVGGTLLAKAYLFVKEKIYANCPYHKAGVRTIGKIGRILEVASFGIFFAWTDSPSFLLAGAVAGVSKMVSMHKFECLTKNDEQVRPFVFLRNRDNTLRVDNLVKGFFFALTLAWYISGMTDKGLMPVDYLNILTYLSVAVLSYPLTRYLATAFSPGKNNPLFNTLRFYFINYQESLALPFMFIRSAQVIGDNSNRSPPFAILRDLLAWISLAMATGANRALLGIRSNRSPNEMSDLALLISWFILASGGNLR